MEILKILGFVLMGAGALINYGAKGIAERTGLIHRIDVNEAWELPPEELENYRRNKAAVRIKLIGLLALLPGAILLILAFR
jgi:hypothetical protein